MCEAFRTPELITDDKIINGIEKIAEKLPRDSNQSTSAISKANIHNPDEIYQTMEVADSTKLPKNESNTPSIMDQSTSSSSAAISSNANIHT